MRRRPPNPPADDESRSRIRLDKWLWFARFYRTRTLAAHAIETGDVRVDGERVKTSQVVRAGARISVRKRSLAWDVDVLAIAERRGSAADAAALYRETPESILAREKVALAQRGASALQRVGRPTKRDRRRLEDFLNEP